MGRYTGASVCLTECGIIKKSSVEKQNKCNEIREREKINCDLKNQERLEMCAQIDIVFSEMMV